MRFYRVATSTEGGNSNGFEWFTSKRDAARAVAQDHELDPREERGRIYSVDIAPTKAGILAALNRYAAHPDNG